ncbi:glycoside hydrolase family 3 N-terminal domain-containing protein [Candidatus Clostridium radicumherbarum]|uniref:beta-glucosidase n=1 Tax=Candidatus Clostridium radicumherbarum TaxID=3381662 RepID=A0ABW8TPZ9_9CLOT
MNKSIRKKLSLLLTLVFPVSMLTSMSFTQTTKAEDSVIPVYLDPDAPVESRVSDLLSRMTLDEKAAQMLQGEIGTGSGNVKPADFATYTLGSVLSGGSADPATGNDAQSWYNAVTALVSASTQTRLHIPTIYGVDAVHGHSNVVGATIFPHNIGLGAIGMGDSDTAQGLVKGIGAATAEEMRVTNIPWTFSPCLANPQNPTWGRSYEGFGEDLELVAKLGTAYVRGLQGDSISELKNPNKAVATIKHYIGEGYTVNGINQGNVTSMTKEQIAAEILKPYADAVAAGARTIMPSYNSIQGVKMTASKYLLTDILKNQLKFDGFVISDYNAAAQITMDENGNAVSGLKNQIKVSVNAGVDMLMQPTNWKTCIGHIISLVNDEIASPGTGIPMSRIDDAVSRILRVKFQAGLFENPISPNPAENPSVASKLGSNENRSLARDAVSKSLVLLKNDNVNGKPILSQLKNMKKVFVAGKSANDIGYQCGGWTIDWQGKTGAITSGTTILQGLQKAAASDQSITYSADGSGAAGNDVAIVIIGEKPYAEGNGDNLNGLGFDSIDKTTLANIKAAGIPTVVVLVSGRPMIIRDYINDWAGLIEAWLPGTEGAGIADVLFGEKDFVGKLPLKWPFYTEAYPLTDKNKQYVMFNTGYGLTKNQVTPELPATPIHPYNVIPDGAKATVLPAKIEAENYIYQSGWDATGNSFIENTTDIGGGKDIGWSGAGKYLKYYIDVPQTGNYKVNFRIASPNGTTKAFSLKDKDNNVLCTVDAPKTGGYQAWTTVTKDIQLNEGKQLVTFYYENAGFNFNWMSITFTKTTAPIANPVPGIYNTNQNVILTSITPDAKIYYTTDGTEPTINSAKYSSPINIEANTTIKAFAVAEGIENSDTTVLNYVIDKICPDYSLTVNGNDLKEGDSFNDYLPLTFKAWDSQTGLASAKVCINETTYTIDLQKSLSLDIDFAGKTGKYKALVTVIDNAGNTTKNDINFEVSSNIGSMRQLMDRFIKSGELKGSLIDQLTNNLNQVQHQLDIQRQDQAVKHMEDFVKHLNNGALAKDITADAKAVLNADANVLIKLWVLADK